MLVTFGVSFPLPAVTTPRHLPTKELLHIDLSVVPPLQAWDDLQGLTYLQKH